MNLSEEFEAEIRHLDLTSKQTYDCSVDDFGSTRLAEPADSSAESSIIIQAAVEITATAKEIRKVTIGLQLLSFDMVPFASGREFAVVGGKAFLAEPQRDFKIAAGAPSTT